jgi:DNA (cytosine-5)-methyltransferase 1
MENVERIKKTQKLQEAISIFKKAGYGLTTEVLNASRYGVPQRRKRCFVIGGTNTSDNFLLPYLDKGSDEEMTVRDHLPEIDTDFYYRHPRSYNRRAIFSVDEPSPTIRGVNRPIPPKYKVHPGDVTHDLSKVRPLTTSERALIQTFPRKFCFDGLSKCSAEQLIGNAVPVKLAEFVAQCLLDYISDC